MTKGYESDVIYPTEIKGIPCRQFVQRHADNVEAHNVLNPGDTVLMTVCLTHEAVQYLLTCRPDLFADAQSADLLTACQ
jgi:hypothetical protein